MKGALCGWPYAEGRELMGHISAKDTYRVLGEKIDGLTMRAPWNEHLRAILTALYSEEEAELVVKMPYSLASLSRLERLTGLERARLERLLESLCSKGLVLDVWLSDRYHYMPSPMVIGIFEFTMMRRGADLPFAEWAKLFEAYLGEGSGFLEANFGEGQQVSVMRALPWEGTIDSDSFVEVLDYERAESIIEEAERVSVGLCSCRHEKLHTGKKTCKTPLEKCTSFDGGAEFLIRNGLARESSRSEALENLAESRELGLVLCADNVKQNVGFMCHCCGCCCNVLLGITRAGFPNTVVTSSFIAASDPDKCTGCAVCSRRCPIGAIEMKPDTEPRRWKFGRPEVDESVCIGCGVCSLRCRSGAMKLHPREKRVLHPENVFEKTILQCLERGTLQNQFFDNPASKSQKFMRAFVGGFLRLPPVKRALMSDLLRSRFLAALKAGASAQGKGAVVDL